LQGVIGVEFTYDLWGDAVNVAGEDGNTGFAGRIQNSESLLMSF